MKARSGNKTVLAQRVYNLYLPAGLRVGVFGGSFNPAHAGHRHVAACARRMLQLDCVLWLVSPQNPLKSVHKMQPLAQRLASAQRAACHPRDRVLALESHIGSNYTIDTVRYLRQHWPNVHFVRIMGADNAVQFHRWRAPHNIMCTMPTLVVGRPTHMLAALASPFARRYAAQRVPHALLATLPTRTAPAWGLLALRYDTHSSTAIRAGLMQDDL